MDILHPTNAEQFHAVVLFLSVWCAMIAIHATEGEFNPLHSLFMTAVVITVAVAGYGLIFLAFASQI